MTAGDDHMIQKSDPDQGARVSQAFRDGDVRARGLELAGRVIVAEDERRGIAQERALEHFAGVQWTLVEVPDGDRVDADDAVPRVEQEGEDVLAVGVADEDACDRGGVRGPVDSARLRRHGAFSYHPE